MPLNIAPQGLFLVLITLSEKEMICELTVNTQPDCIQIAITEDRNLVEYQKESQEMTFSVGNIYLGRVKNLCPD